MATTVTPGTEEKYSVSAVFTTQFPGGKKVQEVILNQYELGYEELIQMQEAVTLALGGALVGLGKAGVELKKKEGKIK